MIPSEKITDLIPHRAPFLWVDSIVDFSENSLQTQKLVPKDLDIFTGHYPGNPILPGVLSCEAIFQTGALLIALLLKDSSTENSTGVPVITRVEGVKFKRPLKPGDTMIMKVTLKEQLGGAWFLKGSLRVHGKIAVQTNFACTLAEID